MRVINTSKTSIFLHMIPKHRWDRSRVLGYLNLLEQFATFKGVYSIAPPRFNRYGNPKEAGLNLTFNNKTAKKAFLAEELTEYYLSELEKVCGKGFVITTSEDPEYKRLVAQGKARLNQFA